MSNENKDVAIPDKLPKDYQDHIDGKNETLTEKMKRLQNEWSIVYHLIINKPVF